MRLNFNVILEFSDEFEESKGNLEEVAENLAHAIEHGIVNLGVAPEDCETYVKDMDIAFNGLILASKHICD